MGDEPRMIALPDETVDALRTFVDREVRAGFTACAEIPDAACESFAGEGASEEDLRDVALRFTAQSLAVLQEESQSWPAVTDCDRLDAAFETLERQGVIARQDFSCCQNCGHSEAWSEVEAALESGRSVHGYAFYHHQDTESAVEGQGLLLAYGATQDGAEAAAAVAGEIVEALEAHGLTVDWDGSVQRRIHVELEWRRRRR